MTAIAKTNQQWILRQRPTGELGPEDLEWREAPLPDVGEGEVLVRTVYLSIDPTNRVWMSDMPQYMEPVELGQVMRGVGVCVVEESRHPGLVAGDLVNAMIGWQRHAVVPGKSLQKVVAGVPLTAQLALFNHIGATAYFGLFDVGQLKPGETVVVSAAAGAVGSLVGQLAKIHGCRAVGIAGSDDKCRWLTEELGLDAAINYKTQDVGAMLGTHCPGGIDVYFENVGGAILDAVLERINLRARIPMCGLISSYNATAPVPGPYNLAQLLMKRARIEGFIVFDYINRYPEAFAKLGSWLAEGRLKYRVDVVDGLENAPDALRRMFAGGNTGKLVVKVSDAPEA